MRDDTNTKLDMVWYAFVICLVLSFVAFCGTGCGSTQDKVIGCAAARIALKIAEAGVDFACPPDQVCTTGGEDE